MKLSARTGPMTKLPDTMAEIAPPESAPRSGPVRWLVLCTFGALLAILLGSSALAIRYLGDMYAQQQAVTRTLAERAQALSSLALSLQQYNEAVQQLVAQAAADRDQAVRRHIEQLTLAIDTDISRYPSDRDSVEAALLGGMQDVFARQQTLYISILGTQPDERRRQAQELLTKRIAPLQKQILDWSGKLHAWNGQKLQHADRSLVAQFEHLQGGLSRALVVGFGSGLLLVMASMVYIVRLERQTRSRYVELARSRHQLQQLSLRMLDAQETERRAISRELHDEIGQALGALLVDIGRLSNSLPDDRSEVKAQVDAMKSVTERTFQAVRNIALLLRPSMLDDLGLVAALEWQGREVSRRSEIEVEVEAEGVSDDLPDEYRVCIYRLVQEALNNAVRHSGAKSAKVILTQTAANIVVRVSDDGRGFDAERTRGLGILGMEERVKRLAGTLVVDSAPNRSTTVSAELPFPATPGVLS